jgi:GNAT superfamily N-acetyltransferase
VRVRLIDGKILERHRSTLIAFLRRHGDQRITHKAIQWLKRLQLNRQKPGTFVAVCFSDKKLIGLTAIGNYGLEEAVIAVHPQYRKRGVGEALLKFSLKHTPKIYTRVACDNLPSLKLCFACGLQAFQVFIGPTGKPTLWLGGGKWNPQDIQKENKVIPLQ